MVLRFASSVVALTLCGCAAASAKPPVSAASRTTAGLTVAAAAPAAPEAGVRLTPDESLCVEAGRHGVQPLSESSFRVDAGGLRAIVAGAPAEGPTRGSGRRGIGASESDASEKGASGTRVELAFTYRGASTSTTPLASGEVRRQIGLKLRAKDTCNVVYVMWHLEDARGIFVSVKHNPGKRTHAECGAGGYIHVRPESATALGVVSGGEGHRLRAEVDERGGLVVLADGREAWRGQLPPEAFAFDGPPGVRSDNAAFDFTLGVDPSQLALGRCAGAPR